MRWAILAAAVWTGAALGALAYWHRLHRRRPLPDEVMLIVLVGEPHAWVLTDLGVAQVPAPHDLHDVDALLALAMEGRL